MRLTGMHQIHFNAAATAAMTVLNTVIIAVPIRTA